MHLRIQNTNERDPLSYAAIKAVSKITQKKIRGFGIRAHDFRDIAATLWQECVYESHTQLHVPLFAKDTGREMDTYTIVLE